ncbi:MAG: hypothetical protein U0236_09335 [Nitrospira sp.]
MKREYEFSRAVRGKLFRKGAELNLPVIKEDQVLVEITDRQMATFDRKTEKNHAEVWDTSKRPR